MSLGVLAFAASAEASSASHEAGCSIGTQADASPTLALAHDGLMFKRFDGTLTALGGSGPAKLQRADLSAVSLPRNREGGGEGIERISTRVERLGQGIAAAPLVHSLMSDAASPRDASNEPKLSMFLLAAAGVMAFVARRRRSS